MGIENLFHRHHNVIEGIVPEKRKQEVLQIVNELLDELGNIFRGVSLIKDLSAKTQNTIVSYGERISSVIISRVINDAVHYDSREFIKTEVQFNKNIVDFDLTNELVRKTFKELPKVALVPGFISSDKKNNDVTNLGRGGSDYTAAILAAALGASRLEIWTDVDGFMTADFPLSRDNFLFPLLTTAFIFLATRSINSISSFGTPWSPNRLLPCILTIESSL